MGKHIHAFENFISESLNEGSKMGLDNTQWSKWPNSKTGDIFLSKRQGVIAIRVDDALRPMYSRFKEGDPVIQNDRAFATDKQFTAQIEPTAKAIADAHYEMWHNGLNTRAKADEFGRAAEEEIKKLSK